MYTEFVNTAYLFSSKALEKKQEILYITKITTTSDGVECHLSIINKVFESGIFGKSKIFSLGPSVFLISLFEEIIVVKYHF